MAKIDYKKLLESATDAVVGSDDIEKVEAPEVEGGAGEGRDTTPATPETKPEEKEGEQALTEEESAELEDALEKTAPAKQEDTLYESACNLADAKLFRLIESDGVDDGESEEELHDEETEVGLDESMIFTEADDGKKTWKEKGKEYWEKIKTFFKNVWEKIKAFFKRIVEHAVNLYYKLIGAYKNAVDTKNAAAGNKGWEALKNDTSVVKNLYDIKKDAITKFLASNTDACVEKVSKDTKANLKDMNPADLTEDAYEGLKAAADTVDMSGLYLATIGVSIGVDFDQSAPVRQAVYYGFRGETVDSIGKLTYMKSFADAVSIIKDFSNKKATETTKKMNKELTLMSMYHALVVKKIQALELIKGEAKINRFKAVHALQIADSMYRKALGFTLSANLGAIDASRTLLIQTTSIARACIKKGA